jgi:hypothetical protein
MTFIVLGGILVSPFFLDPISRQEAGEEKMFVPCKQRKMIALIFTSFPFPPRCEPKMSSVSCQP